MSKLGKIFNNAKKWFKEDSCEGLLRLVNLVPGLAGFSILKDKVSIYFWLFHIPLLLYVYGAGCFAFQVFDAKTPGDFIQNFTSVTILVFVMNNNYFFLKKRPLLKSVVKKVREADELAKKTEEFQDKYKKSLRLIKIIILTFYSINCLNAIFVYMPARMDVTSQFSMRPCVGIAPLTSSPRREICQTLLFLQEGSIMVVVLNFQALLVLLIAHTAVIYQMMSYDMLSLASPKVYDEEHNKLVKVKLPVLISRHVLVLAIVDDLKSLYSVPIGVNFLSNAVCMSLFFYLPLQAWLPYMPILVYCFVVFFLYCFLGQRLINASEEYERSVYACGWESFDLKERKAVYVMLRQAQKPVEILAVDIIPVNIYTFATTLQAMFKFITVVKF